MCNVHEPFWAQWALWSLSEHNSPFGLWVQWAFWDILSHLSLALLITFALIWLIFGYVYNFYSYQCYITFKYLELSTIQVPFIQYSLSNLYSHFNSCHKDLHRRYCKPKINKKVQKYINRWFWQQIIACSKNFCHFTFASIKLNITVACRWICSHFFT